MFKHELDLLIPDPPPPLATELPGGHVTFVSPEIP